jgi:hypothetical protein
VPLGTLAEDPGSHREEARLLGAADAIRQRMGAVRFKIYDAAYEASVAALRNTLGDDDFDGAWAEGAALSTGEAIAYVQRGRGERKRPTSGWASLTPTERDVWFFDNFSAGDPIIVKNSTGTYTKNDGSNDWQS